MQININPDDLFFSFSRSSGPGGQNVNKVNTRVTLYFDLVGCDKLSTEQKGRITRKLATRIGKNGMLRVVCRKHRTQKANRQGALERLNELLSEALKKPRTRRATSVSRSQKEKRLADKRRQSMQKKQRRERDFEDY